MGITNSILRSKEKDSNPSSPEAVESSRFIKPPYDCERSFVVNDHEVPFEQRVTPGGHIMAVIDPRSPNVEISRTPIVLGEEKENSGGGMDKPRRLLLLPRDEKDGGDDNLTPTTGKSLLPDFDPRSPSEEIRRTPIAVDGKSFRDRGQEDIRCPPARVSSLLCQPKRILIDTENLNSGNRF